MNENVAIVGVGWIGFRPTTPELSYKELMYEAAMRAYVDANVDPRRDVDSFVTVAEECRREDLVPAFQGLGPRAVLLE